MEVVSVKFQEHVLKNIDQSINRHHFNSRTEFIREAVRDKLTELEREAAFRQFLSLRGKSRIKTTDTDNAHTRNQTSKEMMMALEKRFS